MNNWLFPHLYNGKIIFADPQNHCNIYMKHCIWKQHVNKILVNINFIFLLIPICTNFTLFALIYCQSPYILSSSNLYNLFMNIQSLSTSNVDLDFLLFIEFFVHFILLYETTAIHFSKQMLQFMYFFNPWWAEL